MKEGDNRRGAWCKRIRIRDWELVGDKMIQLKMDNIICMPIDIEPVAC